MHNPKPLLYLKKKKKAEESTVRRHVIVIALTRKLHVYIDMYQSLTMSISSNNFCMSK